MSEAVYLNKLGVISPLGSEPEQILLRLLTGDRYGLVKDEGWVNDKALYVGKVTQALPQIEGDDPQWHCRNNQLLLAALEPIRESIDAAMARYGSDRVGIIVGTSTSGIGDAESALIQYQANGEVPGSYHYGQQELGNPSAFLAQLLGIDGPAYTISTACSSGAKALASARRLISTGICDVVIAGGADSLCKLTLQGFSSLEAVSAGLCNPFAQLRDGINIGEAAALFLVSKEPAAIALVGAGETSDAHHISAPHPEGLGAIAAMNIAMTDAGISPEHVDYLNLHGTATAQNDAMESIAVNRVLGEHTPVSSTKSLTGHTLGAAGALEAAFCWLLLSELNRDDGLPINAMIGEVDGTLPAINLIRKETSYLRKNANYMMSNSFAFGGNNIALVLKGER